MLLQFPNTDLATPGTELFSYVRASYLVSLKVTLWDTGHPFVDGPKIPESHAYNQGFHYTLPGPYSPVSLTPGES